MGAEKIEVKIDGDTKEMIIREGQALELQEPRIVNLKGVIGAPAEFYKKREAETDPKKSHVVFSYNEMKIELVINETNHYATTVEGSLKLNPDLLKFGINAQKIWTKNELKQFLKMNRAFFNDVDSNMKIVVNLEKFSASVQTQIDDHKDDRGNKKQNLDVKVDSNIDMNFVLNMPIFIGEPNVKFQVEICFDVRENAISIWLESPELQEAIIKQREELINKNLEAFKEKFPVIQR